MRSVSITDDTTTLPTASPTHATPPMPPIPPGQTFYLLHLTHATPSSPSTRWPPRLHTTHSVYIPPILSTPYPYQPAQY
ncbi:hypothetical protein Hamer_G007250 [Homarus americanus]|uniref:Uncharacterized protein n=1 Tax=Homarus americanus TaxID=6706 RepID=A0A8J5K116_HOMAM|nr:hypothetical protein Hamer_G007250 [Homarus americanus]